MTGKGGKGIGPKGSKAPGRGRAASESGRLSMSLLARGRTTITSQDADEVSTMLTQRSTSCTSMSDSALAESAEAPSSAVSTPTATPTIFDESVESQEELFSQPLVPLPAPGDDICEKEQSDVEDVSLDEDDEVVDVTWKPRKQQQEEEGSSEGESDISQRGSNKRSRKKSRSPSSAPPGRAPPVTPTTTKAKKTTAGSSLVWNYFALSSKDSTKVICNLCMKKLSRGTPSGRPGTTCMRRHLQSDHAALWRECHNPTSTDTPSSGDSRPSTPSVPSSTPPPSTPVFPSTSARKCLQQTSMLTFVEGQKKMSPTSQLARRLTSALTELIVRQLLSYHLVDTAAFKKFAAVAAPTWKVPSRKFMSETAVPHLHRHVQSQLTSSLAHSVGGKVHLTTDTWSSKHGQGRYMTVTAHWVNLQSRKPLSHGQLSSKLELVEPPRMARLPAATSSSSSSSSLRPSPAESPSPSSVPSELPRSYGHCQVRRCHAVLSMECLGPQSHTALVLWTALQAQEAQWLTPHNLRLGHVVSDNGSNLVAALKLGNVLHVPCLAHVLNIVVQKFIHKYPGLQEMIKLARKVSGHFRRSYTAMARLEAIQKKHHLPVRRLVCDSSTRWNSTLFMLDRLCQQRHAVIEYLCDTGYATATRDLGAFTPQHWVLMRDVCRLLRPFSDITNLVSRSEANISDMIPYIVMLQRALQRITDRAVDEREYLEDLAVSGEAEGDTEPPGPTQREELQEEEEEEADFAGDDEEEELPHLGPSQVGCHLSGTPAIVRGWAEDTEEDNVASEDEPDLTSASNLVGMGSFLLSLLKKDPRVKHVMDKEELYWVATMLHPNYKHKVLELMPPAQQRDVGRIQALTNRLKNLLYAAFPSSGTTAAGSGARRGNPPATTKPARRSADVAVTVDMLSFFSPGNQASSSAPTTMSTHSHRDRLDRQVNDYMSITADMHTFHTEQDPLNYWLSRLDIWPQLSELAMEILSCPASSVLSERTFSAAGGIVTDKRTRLAHSSVDYLTFIKMNEEWISEAYCMGPPD